MANFVYGLVAGLMLGQVAVLLVAFFLYGRRTEVESDV